MLEPKRSGSGLLLGLVLLLLHALASWSLASPERTARPNEIARHISILKYGKTQDKAASAYWLGQQHIAAAPAVDALAALLGDTRPVNAAQYRLTPVAAQLKLGEEAA